MRATYDVAGNLTAYGVYGYSWDAGGMLSRTSNGTSLFRYVYTADDERIGMEEISTYGTSTLDRWSWSIRMREPEGQTSGSPFFATTSIAWLSASESSHEHRGRKAIRELVWVLRDV